MRASKANAGRPPTDNDEFSSDEEEIARSFSLLELRDCDSPEVPELEDEKEDDEPAPRAAGLEMSNESGDLCAQESSSLAAIYRAMLAGLSERHVLLEPDSPVAPPRRGGETERSTELLAEAAADLMKASKERASARVDDGVPSPASVERAAEWGEARELSDLLCRGGCLTAEVWRAAARRCIGSCDDNLFVLMLLLIAEEELTREHGGKPRQLRGVVHEAVRACKESCVAFLLSPRAQGPLGNRFPVDQASFDRAAGGLSGKTLRLLREAGCEWTPRAVSAVRSSAYSWMVEFMEADMAAETCSTLEGQGCGGGAEGGVEGEE